MTIFLSEYDKIGKMIKRTAEEIERESMWFSADANFLYLAGGPIMKEFITHLDPKKNWIIDSRSHMLMPGWFPCIPGWHHDDVPRNSSPDLPPGFEGQPNYYSPAYHSEHVMAIVDAGTKSFTEFAEGYVNVRFPYSDLKATVYGEWDQDIEQQRGKDPSFVVNRVKNRDVMRFDYRTFHRGMPAKKHGWRWFARATDLATTERKIENKKRTQVQVYMSALTEGW